MLYLQSFQFGKYSIKIHLELKEEKITDTLDLSYFSGFMAVQGFDVSFFKLRVFKKSNQYRFKLQLKSKKGLVYETVNHHTSVRLLEMPNPLNNGVRSKQIHPNIKILYLDQLHVLKKFQRQRCGTKLVSLILIWSKYLNLGIKKCVVVSPSSIGKPFYVALGAVQEITSNNVVFLL